MPRSIHDNTVLSYTVDCKSRSVTLRTSFKSSPVEFTDVVFRGVAAYDFQDDCFGNILFGIEEEEPAQVISTAKEKFENGRGYGWPGPWNSSLKEAIAFARKEGLRGFVISASLGLNGWILAKEMSIVEGSSNGAAG